MLNECAIIIAYFVCEYMRDELIFFEILCFFVQLIFLIEKNVFIYVALCSGFIFFNVSVNDILQVERQYRMFQK